MATDGGDEAVARYCEKLEQSEQHSRDERERLRQKYEEARKAELDDAFSEAIHFSQNPGVAPDVRVSWMKLLWKGTRVTLDSMRSTYEKDLETAEKQSHVERDNAFKQFSTNIVNSCLRASQTIRVSSENTDFSKDSRNNSPKTLLAESSVVPPQSPGHRVFNPTPSAVASKAPENESATVHDSPSFHASALVEPSQSPPPTSRGGAEAECRELVPGSKEQTSTETARCGTSPETNQSEAFVAIDPYQANNNLRPAVRAASEGNLSALPRPQTATTSSPKTTDNENTSVPPSSDAASVTEIPVESTNKQASETTTQVPRKRKRAASLTNDRNFTKHLKTKRSIPFDEVYQNGNPIHKDAIVEYDGQWYILKCEEHGVHFKQNAFRAAGKHLQSRAHCNLETSKSNCIQHLGYVVDGCTAELAKKHNDMVRQAYQRGHVPQNLKRSSCIQTTKKGFKKRQATITDPTAGKLYYAADKPAEPGGFPRKYIVMILGWKELDCCGLPGKKLADLQLFQTKLKTCYRYDQEGISGWAEGFEADGKFIERRYFPVIWFEEKGRDMEGWVRADQLSSYPFHPHPTPSCSMLRDEDPERRARARYALGRGELSPTFSASQEDSTMPSTPDPGAVPEARDAAAENLITVNAEVFESELDTSGTDMDIDTDSDDGVDMREAIPGVDHGSDSNYSEQDVKSSPSQSFQAKAPQQNLPSPTAAASSRQETEGVRAPAGIRNLQDKSQDNPSEAGRTEDTGLSSPTNTKSIVSINQEQPITNSTQDRIQPEMPKAGSTGAEAASVATLPENHHHSSFAMPEDISQSQQRRMRVEEAAPQNESHSTPRDVAQSSTPPNNRQSAPRAHQAMAPNGEVTALGSQQIQNLQPLDPVASESLLPDQKQSGQQILSNHGPSANQDAPRKTSCGDAQKSDEGQLAESEVRQPQNMSQIQHQVPPTVIICGDPAVADAVESNPGAQSGPRVSQNSAPTIPTAGQLATDEVVGETETGERRVSQNSNQMNGQHPTFFTSVFPSGPDPALRDPVEPRTTGHLSPSKAPNWSPDNRWRAVRHSHSPAETPLTARSTSVASSGSIRPSVSPTKSRGREGSHTFYVSYFKEGGAWKYPAAAVRLTTTEDGRATTDASQPEEYRLVIDPAQVEKLQYNKSRAQDKFEVVLFDRGGAEQRLVFLAGFGGLTRQGIKLFKWIRDVNEEAEVIAGGDID